MQQGWVKIYRIIQDHWLWAEKPFDKRSAWFDLLLSANHEENTFTFGKEIVTVKAGSFITSQLKLSKRWGWSRHKVTLFFNKLSNDNQITVKTDNKKTTLTIVNYSLYQCQENEKDIKRTSKGHQKDTNKNEKNEKKKDIVEKIKFAEFVSMTQIEFNKLLAAHGTENVTKMIEILDNYKGSNNKKYASDYRAILTWVKDKVLKEAPVETKKKTKDFNYNS